MHPEVKKIADREEYWFEEGCYITEVANDPGDTQLSIARARVAPGGTTAWHSLDGVVERYIIVAGRGRVEVGDRLVEEVGPGDVVRIPENTRQRITNISSQDLIFFAVCSPPFSKEHYRSVEK